MIDDFLYKIIEKSGFWGGKRGKMRSKWSPGGPRGSQRHQKKSPKQPEAKKARFLPRPHNFLSQKVPPGGPKEVQKGAQDGPKRVPGAEIGVFGAIFFAKIG